MVETLTRLSYDPLGDGRSALAVIDHMGDDLRVVQAARVSHGRDSSAPDPARDAKLIGYLLQHGHWSPFEHCMLTVMVKCPLFVRSQWHRHRSWSFNEISRRYTSEEIDFYIPPQWRGQAPSNRQASEGCVDLQANAFATRVLAQADEAAVEKYQAMMDMGVAREQARMVLPQSLYTRFYATANLRSLLHFIQVRDHEGAQWETVQYARCLSEIIAAHWPLTWTAWRDLKEQ
jgi:thymidylate synthase (FAD)